jgi:phosphoribosylanthranilate isomerase
MEVRAGAGVRIKICGITSVADAREAAAAGADAVGLNFVGGPRELDADRAADIRDALPPEVMPVALVRVSGDRIDRPGEDFLKLARISHLQVYGDVSPESLLQLRLSGFEPMPVLAVRDERFHTAASEWLRPDCLPAAIVLDRFHPQREGGTGAAFRWDWVAAARESGRLAAWPPIVLAGGLRPGNVAEAIRIAQPAAVDVSSGVEPEGQPGRKDPALMRAFVHAARAAFG